MNFTNIKARQNLPLQETVIQSEVSQKEKNKYHMLTQYMESKKKKWL